MAIPKVEIKNRGITTKIFIDGQEIDHVRSVHFSHEAGGELPVLSIQFVAADLYLDGEFVPALPEPFDKWYERKATLDESEASHGGNPTPV